MKRSVLTLTLALGLSLLVVGCAGSSSAETPGASPTPEKGRTETGIAAVDAAIKAVLAGDQAALASQAVFTTQACTTAQGAGGPPQCQRGEASGTRLEVMSAASCEGYYVRRADLAAEVQRFLEGEFQLYGVYKNSGKIFTEGEYAIIFSHKGAHAPPGFGRQVFVSKEGVTALNFGCGQSPADLVSFQGLKDVIIAP